MATELSQVITPVISLAVAMPGFGLSAASWSRIGLLKTVLMTRFRVGIRPCPKFLNVLRR